MKSETSRFCAMLDRLSPGCVNCDRSWSSASGRWERGTDVCYLATLTYLMTDRI